MAMQMHQHEHEHEHEDEYLVLQALSEEAEPLDTFHVYRGDRRVASFLTETRVRAFFSHKYVKPIRDESRFPRCPICNTAMPPDSPRHLQAPDGQITRGHRFVEV
jgi:hypothetical protein